MGAFRLRALSAPMWALVVSLILLGMAGAVLRGDRLRRVAVLVLAACALPWAVATALAACTDDPALALAIYRGGIGPIGIAGPAILFLVLSDAGRLDSHRLLVGVAGAIAIASMILCWSTSLVLDGTLRVAGGMLYPSGGPLNGPHIAQIAIWPGVGIAIARRGQRHSRDRSRRLLVRVGLVIAVLAMIGTSDFLITIGVWHGYPMAWLPGGFAALLGAWVLWRTNRMRAEGIDRHGALELVLTIMASAGVVAIVLAASGGSAARPLTLAAITAPLPALAFLLGLPGRNDRPARLPSRSGDAMLGFAEGLQAANTDEGVAHGLAQFLRARGGALAVRVWRMGADGLAPLTDDSPTPPLDARVRAWLVANRAPIVAGDVASMRLGGMRALIEGFVVQVDADVIVPLVDRDAMVGLATVNLPDGRTPRPAEREVIAEAAQAAAQALTFTGLRREAEVRAQSAREVEVADAMQQARADGDVRVDVGRWRVMACYRPGAKVAGDVWTWAELRGGDLLLVVGDVIGRGLSAALISAAVAGAVESAAALRGGELAPDELLELLNDTVTGVSGPTATLGAFAAVLGHGRVRFAAAGHRGAYLVRGGAAPDTRAEVIALAAPGTPLGDRALHIGRGEAELAADDLLVIASDGVIDVTDPRGAHWSERRLVRALRSWVPKAGDQAAEQLVSAAAVHAGESPIDDDLVVVAARARS